MARGLDTRLIHSRVDAGARRGLLKAAQAVLDTSNALVPVKSGSLERTGEVSDDGDRTAAVSYDTPYAEAVHEDVFDFHLIGQSKFLETALFRDNDAALQEMAAALRKELDS